VPYLGHGLGGKHKKAVGDYHIHGRIQKNMATLADDLQLMQ
jgi:hypothetical protein